MWFTFVLIFVVFAPNTYHSLLKNVLSRVSCTLAQFRHTFWVNGTVCFLLYEYVFPQKENIFYVLQYV
jgi:hypothetical protein